MEPDYILCDSHAHLTDNSFANDLDDVLKRAREAQVGIIVVPGNDISTSERAIQIAKEHEGIYAAVGLHPHDARLLELERNTLEHIARVGANDGTVVAVGETGLDYYYNLSSREDQLAAFRWHVGLAHELDLPVIIHSRKAEEDIKSVIKLVGVPTASGVLHCFSGDKDFALWGIDNGLQVSFSGTITFNMTADAESGTKITPLRKTLIETDSPYLAPVPKRGKRNEPAYLPFTAEKLAADRDIHVDDVYAETTLTARELFQIPVDFGGAIIYEIGGNLYVNLTNRCTNRCVFCIREFSDGVGGYDLRLRAEPTATEIVEAVGDPSRYDEIVFCGYGEPTIRWETVKEAARAIKKAGGYIRLNTNGLSAQITDTDITKGFPGLVDEVSVSLNAPDAGLYYELCRPEFGDKAWPAVLDFVQKARAIVKTRVSMVRHPTVDEEVVRRFAEDLGVPLKVRG
ncbi:MAG: YchF/TatD family DNA exonuclease [Candidatus Coatesbacteria bacterium]|nr:MAG: YchF/TatD family DNA exonuclease [Candidatus Coatesbacteria bacterium]